MHVAIVPHLLGWGLAPKLCPRDGGTERGGGRLHMTIPTSDLECPEVGEVGQHKKEHMQNHAVG